MAGSPILPGTGRGTSRRLVEGAPSERLASPQSPSTTTGCAGGPPPRAGEDL